MDALALKELPEVFDSVIDSGLVHVFSDDDRRQYLDGLATILKPGDKLFLLCFSDLEPGTPEASKRGRGRRGCGDARGGVRCPPCGGELVVVEVWPRPRAGEVLAVPVLASAGADML